MRLVKISEVKPNPSNPRVIKDHKFTQLKKSLEDFPDMANVRPIVVNKDMVVLGGNMRLKAMKDAGWKQVPVEVVDWPEEKQREFIIKDNVGFGEWDWQLISADWPEAEEWGLEVPNVFSDETEYDTTIGQDSKGQSEYELLIKIISDKDNTLKMIEKMEIEGLLEILKK